jgi:hypothetical protein
MKPERNNIAFLCFSRKKGHGSGMLIAILQALLSIANSMDIFHSLRSLLTDSSQVGLGRSLPLFTLSTRFRTPLRTGASGGLRWTCPNHLNWWIFDNQFLNAIYNLNISTAWTLYLCCCLSHLNCLLLMMLTPFSKFMSAVSWSINFYMVTKPFLSW